VPQTIYRPTSSWSIEAFSEFSPLAFVHRHHSRALSRPYARVVFSKVAIIAPFDGIPK